jgi:HEAT repeat protein
MRKMRWIGAAAALALVAVAVAVAWPWSSGEPFYNGKQLSFWLQAYGLPGGRRLSQPAAGPSQAEADEAVRGIGTNAIPELLRMLVYRRSPLLAPLLQAAEMLHFRQARNTIEYERNHEALGGLRALGEKAAGATPELIKLYDSHPDAFSRQFIVMALGIIGSNAKEGVPVVLRATTNASPVVRIDATAALGYIRADPARVVPVLILCLRDTNVDVRRNAISSLEQFGQEAKSATPALLQLLRDEKYDPAAAPRPAKYRSGPISVEMGPPATRGGPFGPPFDLGGAAAAALWEIDPDAAAKAGLKEPQ